MTDNNFTVVIPTRYGSSRFPGKPLHPLNGKPMILHVIDRARESQANCIIVATDDERIARVCEEVDVQVEMTRADHPSGTDRIAEVAQRMAWSEERVIVGLQGDEPATPAVHLNLLANNLRTHSDADMATLCVPVVDLAEYNNRSRVKVVRDKRGMALYFSRASIPARRDPLNDDSFPRSFIHVGLYAYRCGYLMQYSALSESETEQEEQLEQLRVLHHGGRIHVAEVVASRAHGVDQPSDVASVEAVLQDEFS